MLDATWRAILAEALTHEWSREGGPCRRCGKDANYLAKHGGVCQGPPKRGDWFVEIQPGASAVQLDLTCAEHYLDDMEAERDA